MKYTLKRYYHIAPKFVEQMIWQRQRDSARISPPSLFIHSFIHFGYCRVSLTRFITHICSLPHVVASVFSAPRSLSQFEWLKNNTHSWLKRFFSVKQTNVKSRQLWKVVNVIRLFNENVKVEFGVSLLEVDEPAMRGSLVFLNLDANFCHLCK